MYHRQIELLMALLLTLLSLASCHDGRIKYIGNRLVEEFERMEIPLDEYFQGELATFQMQIDQTQGSVPPEISSMISLSNPFKHFSWDFIDAKSFKKIKVQPFKRSTLIRDEIIYRYRNGTTKSMEFVSRDLKFHQYNLSSYIDQGDINKVHELQLNVSSLGEADCHDLTYQFNNDYEFFLLFCERFEVSGFFEEVIYSVVHINKTLLQTEPSSQHIIKEYEFRANDLNMVMDFDSGIRMIKTHINRDVDPDIYNKVFFKVFQNVMIHQSLQGKQLIVISLNMSVFEEMEKESINYTRGPPIIQLVQTFALNRQSFLYLHITDSLILRDDKFTRNDLTYWAFTMSDDTIDICAINRYDIGNKNNKIITCSGKDVQRVTMPGYKIAAFYKDVEAANGMALGNDMNFYGICSQPPAIIEYDMRDPDNIIINKIYTVDRREENWIGTMRIAVNQNYVLHLLSDPVTGLQVIRVFDRYQSLHNSAKFDIPIFSSTIADYFQFPNRFFNIVILRDERTVNVTALLNYAIVLDGTEVLSSDIIDREFQVTLFASFRSDIIADSFTVTFIDRYNTSIIPIGDQDGDVFYNCGEPSLNYQVSLLLNGPNYNLSQADSANRTGFFEFENQDLKLFQSAALNFSQCQTNFLFPYQHTYDQVYRQTYDQDYEMPPILVCVDDNTLSSYLMRMGNHTLMVKTNTIKLPEVNVVDVVGDQQERTILLLAENPAYGLREQQTGGTVGLTGEKYELHFFSVQNQLLWHTSKNFGSYTNITVFNYDSILNNCVIVDLKQYAIDEVEGDNNGEQILYYEKIRTIHVNLTSFKITIGSISDLILVGPQTRTAKVAQVGEHVIYALTLDRRIIQYQIGKQRIMQIRELELENLVNFDIFDGKYFIAYREQNIIDVFTIELHLYLRYKMRLPLYLEYESFQFRMTIERNMALPVPIRAYYSDFFSFLMVDQKDKTRTFLFIHCLAINQHNSFVLVRDFTQLLGYKNGLQIGDDDILAYGNIILAGDRSGKTTLGAMSIDRIHLFDAQFYNKLTLNSMGFQELMRVCRNIKVNYDFFGKEIDSNIVIDTISVWPYSLFSDANREDTNNVKAQMINLKVRTLNQGLSPSTKNANQKGPINIFIANETTSTSQTLQLLHESYIEGQALKFVTKCKYIDWNGQEVDCSAGVEEVSRDVPYKFPIEFVTSTRRVERSFTMGKLYFMFDNLNQLVVSRLPLYQKNLDGVDGFPLIKLYQGSQVQLFDCEIHGFADYYHLDNYTQQHAKNQVNGSETYLLFYQCKALASTMRKVLKYALITVFPFKVQYNDNTHDQTDKPFNVQTFLSNIELPYDIIDLEVFNLQYEFDNFNRMQLTFYIGYSCNIENSYSNVIYIDELYIWPDISLAGLKRHIGMLSASIVGNDTFKVTKLVKIGGSNLIIAVLDDFGAQILNLTRLDPDLEKPRLSEIILAELDIMKEVEKYNMQYQLHQEKGELQVWAATFNNPYSIYLISNYGLFIFDFNVNLESERDIKMNGGYLGLINQQIRHYRMIFDEFNGQVASNQYGSAFLVSKNIDCGQYEVYLIDISYSTAANSRVLKYISVTWNEKCYSLNHDFYYVNSPEDQIAVSFICNQYLKIYRACMRPHVDININQFFSNATHYDHNQHDFEPGVYKYNMFNLTMYGVNSMLSSIEEALFDQTNTEVVEIRLFYKERCYYERAYAMLALGIIIVIAVLFFVYIFMDQKQNQEDQDSAENNKTERFKNVSFLTTSSADKQQLRLTLRTQKSDYTTESSILQQTQISSSTTQPHAESVNDFFFSFRNKRTQEGEVPQEFRMSENQRLMQVHSNMIEQEIFALRKSSAAARKQQQLFGNTGLQVESVMSSHSRGQSEVSGNFGPYQQQSKNSNRGSVEANEQQREESELQSMSSSQIEDPEKIQKQSQV